MNTEARSSPPYGRIFLSLFGLTVLEIAAVNLPMARILVIPGLVSFAIMKSFLVAAFYMRLRFEKGLLTVILAAPLLFGVILTLLAGFDVSQIRYLRP